MAPRQTHGYERRRLRLMASFARGETVLDLGFAQTPSPYLGEFHTVGLDLEPPAELPQGYAEQMRGDVTRLDEHLGSRQFDSVLCGELIEHLERPYDFLREVSKVVAPGGRLVLSTPNAVGLPTVFYEWARSHKRFYTTDHRYYFTPRWVERMLGDTGWRCTEMRAVGLWLPFGVIGACPVALSYQVIYVAEAA
jgi:SAM-dependent methyltransferase